MAGLSKPWVVALLIETALFAGCEHRAGQPETPSMPVVTIGTDVASADHATSGVASVEVSNAVPRLAALKPAKVSLNAGLFGSNTFGIGPMIDANQGYATDGHDNFLFSTTTIVETDSRWAPTFENLEPFSGIPGVTLKHIGDGEVSGGNIYAPLSCLSQQNCAPVDYAIGVYSAGTPGLPLKHWADITSSGCDASGIAVGPDNTLYVSSYYVNPEVLCLFDATSLAPKGHLTLSTPIPRIQGISYDPASRQFAVTADDESQTRGYIYLVSLNGQVTGPVYTVPQSGELEGLDFTQGYIGYLINPHVYFLFPITISGAGSAGPH